MAGKDIIIMTRQELRRISIIHSVISKQITQQEAANILCISRRQVIRIVARVKKEGNIGVVHKSRGCRSCRAVPRKLKDTILRLCRNKYKGFNPTFTAEKLLEIEQIRIHSDTLRKWFIEAEIPYKKRKGPKHRRWRERKEAIGMMVQLDGSHHQWFGDKWPWCVLMGYVDDATGRVFIRFYEYEGTMPAMDSFKRYIKKYGIPQSVYVDKHTTYKSNKKTTIEDELSNIKAMSQFERALKELGVNVIHADSPQAKGRVERSFRTHQDRLIKEMELQGIKSIDEANKFVSRYYTPKHNRKFAIAAKDIADLHRDVPKGLNLDRVFCIKNKASLRNDFTVQYKSRFYQVLDAIRAKHVTVEEGLDGKIQLYYKDKQLRYKVINRRPPRDIAKKTKVKSKKPYKLPADHPYRKFKRFWKLTG